MRNTGSLRADQAFRTAHERSSNLQRNALSDAATIVSTNDKTGANAPGFGIYVHWPFCLSKCPYCDFNSHVRHEKPDEVRFAQAISSELAHAAEVTGKRTVNSIF